jgi:hypothetical protein
VHQYIISFLIGAQLSHLFLIGAKMSYLFPDWIINILSLSDWCKSISYLFPDWSAIISSLFDWSKNVISLS